VSKVSQDSNLDILRSIAVLAVFLTHALQVISGSSLYEHFSYGVDTFALGRSGVLIFFVHTSLVLMQSLERTGKKLSGWSLVQYFYIRRAFRIYPLAIFLILFSITLSVPPDAMGTPYEWRGVRWVAANILLIQNITYDEQVSGPLWSLPFEVQMYLILPILFLLLRGARGSGRLILVVYSTGVLIGRYGKFHRLVMFLPCFLAGVIAYKLLGTVRPRLRSWLWCPAVIGAVTLYVATPYSDENWWKNTALCLAVGLLIPWFQRDNGAIGIAASQVAKYSYGIYLCHTPLMWLIYRKLTIPGWQRAILLVMATGACSMACYHVIEHPLIQIGTRVANRVTVKLRASTDDAIS
jgi:peptidoglycan/LPS O-acetylase OafA/YrhL